MKPALPLGVAGKRALYLLGLLAALKAAGLVLIAQAVASGIASLAVSPTAVSATAVSPTADWSSVLVLGISGALLRALATWWQEAVAQRAATGAKEELRTAITTRVMNDGGTSADAGTGALSILVTRGLDGLDNYYTKYLPALVTCAVVPLLVGARILAADWLSAVVIVVTVPLIPVFMILIGLHTQDKVQEASASLNRLSDHLLELSRGLPVLVGLGRAGSQTRALRDVAGQYRTKTIETLKVAFLSSLALELIATISVALVAVVIGVRLIGGDLSLEIGLLALILAPECYQPLRDLGAAHHASEEGLDALERSRRITDAPRSRVLLPDAVAVADSPAITVSGLTIGYGGRDGTVVDGLTFTLPRGTISVLTGPSGAGKTSVLQVLAGLRGDGAGTRVAGTITGAHRQEIAWIPQHPVLVAETVADEIGLYSGLDSAAERREAAARALNQVDATGLLDARTGDLSPGELRRVAVARALARIAHSDIALLLADEPTAHLDAQGARSVEAALARLRGRTTILLVAHNPETASLADQTIGVSGGSAAGHDGGARLAANTGNTGNTGNADSALQPDGLSVPSGVGKGVPVSARRVSLTRSVAMVQPWRRRFVSALLFGAGATLFAVALTAVSGWMIVRASEQIPILYLLTAIVGVRFFGIGRSVLRYCERLRLHDAVFESTDRLRLRLWNGLLERPAAWRKLARGGKVLEQLVGDVDELRDLTPRAVFAPLVGVLTAVAASVTTAVVLPAGLPSQLVLVTVCLVVSPLLVLAADRSARRAAVGLKAEILDTTARMLAAAPDLSANSAAGVLRSDLRALEAELSAKLDRSAWAQGLANALTVLTCSLGSLAMLSSADGVNPAAAAVVILMQLALIEPFIAVNTAIHHLGAWRAVGDRVVPDLGSTTIRAERPPGASVSSLELRGASYTYPDQTAPAFSDVSLDLRRGEWLAVTGPSGSGKSTLLGALLGFLPMREGSYLINGEPVGLARAGTAGATGAPRIAWCPQEAHLFQSSIRANLALARTPADPPSEAELAAALARAGLGDFVHNLPAGLDTQVGPGGTWLSGGQQQRLAVGRALLTRADVVLLDEPTAHLDPVAARDLLADLRAGLADRFVVMVTHNQEEAALCERALELSGRARQEAIA
ncbi:thiol reductant ABC exporter subunit CydD [Arthrobacter sp. Sr33]|uniref:thiol reductant ABC exporter subunit CydD n=1 Tax=Arthrobacter sp. TB 23 TaxID=494419 RepID=UPI0002E9D5E9|nr:thiol reductant ABC exporter subunit CydD [Arthrobacter sp. TB 23]